MPVCKECSDIAEETPWNEFSSNFEEQIEQNEEKDYNVPNTVEGLISKMKEKIELKTRYYKFRRRRKCFSGYDAIEWITNFSKNIKIVEAFAICEAAMYRGMIEHVTKTEPFHNSKTEFYRFCDNSNK